MKPTRSEKFLKMFGFLLFLDILCQTMVKVELVYNTFKKPSDIRAVKDFVCSSRGSISALSANITTLGVIVDFGRMGNGRCKG